MPDMPSDGRRNTTSISYAFLAAGGDRAGVRYDNVPAAVTLAQVQANRAAYGRISNAQVMGQVFGDTIEIAEVSAAPLDEAFADANTKLVLVFQNTAFDVAEKAIPAPDVSLFGTDGVSVITPDYTSPATPTPASLLGAAINTTLAILNAGGSDYAFLKGYRSKRAGKLPRPRTSPTLAEPGVDTYPPDAPAT